METFYINCSNYIKTNIIQEYTATETFQRNAAAINIAMPNDRLGGFLVV